MASYYTSVWFWLLIIGIVLFIIGLIAALYQYYHGTNNQNSTSNISTWVWVLLGLGAFLILIGIIFAIVGYDDTPAVVETKTTTTTVNPVAPVAPVTPTTTSVVTTPVLNTPVTTTPVMTPNSSVVYQNLPAPGVTYVTTPSHMSTPTGQVVYTTPPQQTQQTVVYRTNGAVPTQPGQVLYYNT